MRDIVIEISSDEYEGRGPGSRGDVMARDYLAAEMQRLGLQPGAADGTWEQKFDLVGVTTAQPDTWTFEGDEETRTLEQPRHHGPGPRGLRQARRRQGRSGVRPPALLRHRSHRDAPSAGGRMKAAISLLCGTLFGAGLAISGMTNPAKVLSFLDVLGAWDPTLAFVMGSALAVSAARVEWRRGARGSRDRTLRRMRASARLRARFEVLRLTRRPAPPRRPPPGCARSADARAARTGGSRTRAGAGSCARAAGCCAP